MSDHLGDIYWLPVEADAIPHPHVIVEEREEDSSFKLCAITSNLKRLSLAGNVLLEAGEANLTRASVVEVSKTREAHPAELGAYIGRLSAQRLEEILDGIRFVERSFRR